MKKNCIALFIKYPQNGKVKTRLAADIGKNNATALYKNFVADILATTGTISSDCCIFYYPARSKKKFTGWLGKSYSLIAQSGNDLGEKMKNAFMYGFNKGYANIVILGSDSPDLPPRIIQSAFSSLKQNKIVIGPSWDGGYYLIGCTNQSFNPDIFTDIPWSTGDVFIKTMKKCNKYTLSVHLLPRWHDIDTSSDLNYLYHNGKSCSFKNSHTMEFLSDKDLHVQ